MDTNEYYKIDKELKPNIKQELKIALILSIVCLLFFSMTVIINRGMEGKERESLKTSTISTPAGDFTVKKAVNKGEVVITFPDGSVYEGPVNKEGMPDGRGKYTFSEGGAYEGELKDGKPHGFAISIQPDGAKYEGQFREGKVQSVLDR